MDVYHVPRNKKSGAGARAERGMKSQTNKKNNVETKETYGYGCRKSRSFAETRSKCKTWGVKGHRYRIKIYTKTKGGRSGGEMNSEVNIVHSWGNTGHTQ